MHQTTEQEKHYSHWQWSLCLLLVLLPSLAAAAEYSAPMTVPAVSYEAASVLSEEEAPLPADNTGPPDSGATAPLPPVLLRRDTPPDSAPPLIPAPALAVAAPLPAVEAGNCIQRDEEGQFLGWMDYQHCVFSGRTLATAVWFDDLFGDWHDSQASMMLRAISEITTTEADGARVRFRLRASAALPNAKKRLRLVVTDDSDTDESVGGQDVLSQLQGERDKVSAALRWIPFERAGVQADFDIGVRGVAPPDIFVRSRLRKSWGITQDSALRFGQTFRYGSESLGSSITQLDYEYAVSNKALARLSSAYEYRQDNHEMGMTWAHGISMSHVISGYRSLGYGFSANGHTQPNWKDDNFGPWVLYRSNWLRPWLFYELEPRMTWYNEGDKDEVVSLTFRIEVQLGRK